MGTGARDHKLIRCWLKCNNNYKTNLFIYKMWNIFKVIVLVLEYICIVITPSLMYVDLRSMQEGLVKMEHFGNEFTTIFYVCWVYREETECKVQMERWDMTL